MSSKSLLLLTATVAILFLSAPHALAHEGHGSAANGDGNSLRHYLSEPIHVAQIIAVVVTLVVLTWAAAHVYYSRKRNQSAGDQRWGT
ncbi:MAG: hypothetical protein KF752_02400 [Pirellulaceae bacterium]|nr:hypothetical protein [Pirellulaceae bacterium]